MFSSNKYQTAFSENLITMESECCKLPSAFEKYMSDPPIMLFFSILDFIKENFDSEKQKRKWKEEIDSQKTT